jgi:multiple sugar transport system permease protein
MKQLGTAFGFIKTKRAKDSIFSFLLLLPALLSCGLVLIYPLCKSLLMSLFDISLMRPGQDKFIGFDNYVNLAHSPNFWSSLWITFSITIAVVLGSILFGLIFALLLNSSFKGRAVMRSLIVIPWAIPPVAAVLSWIWVLDSQFGILNYTLRALGLIQQNIQWLADVNMAPFSVITVQIWKQIPIATVMMLAGLQTIPFEHYEAAAIDGANFLQKLYYVTIPGLRKSAGIVVLLITIWTFRQFTLIFLMTEGGPSGVTETLVIQIYREAFQFFRMGYATAFGTITFVISLIFGAIYFASIRERGTK